MFSMSRNVFNIKYLGFLAILATASDVGEISATFCNIRQCYKPGGLLSTDCKNKRVRDRFDYNIFVGYKVQNFENLTFCRRLATTNWSVSIFSALRADTFIEKYMEIQ